MASRFFTTEPQRKPTGFQELGHGHLCMCARLLQTCPTLCDPMDYSPPDSTVHGILQARILERVVISFSRGSSPPGDLPHLGILSIQGSGIGRQVLYHQRHLGSPWTSSGWGGGLLFCLQWHLNHFFHTLKRIIFTMFLLHRAACGICVPQPAMEPKPPVVEAWSLNHWPAREVLMS